MSGKSVVIIAPNSFDRFHEASKESQFQLLTKSGFLASLPNLQMLFNPFGSREPRLNQGKKVNPMAGYFLESFLKVRGYDARVVFEWDDDEKLTEAMKSDPFAVLFSTTYVTDKVLLASSIKSIRRVVGKSVPLIVGGPYIWKHKYEFINNRQLVQLKGKSQESLKPRIEALSAYNVDVEADSLFSGAQRGDIGNSLRDAIYVAQEFGEHSLLRLLEAIEKGHTISDGLDDVPNLVFPRGHGAWFHTPEVSDPVDLNGDYTRWDLVDDVPVYRVPLRTSVGCPFKCRYCDFIQLHPEVRERSPESIKEEIQLAQRRGAVDFNFIDDNIFLSKERIKQLTTMIVSHDLGIQWGGFFRVDRVDEKNVVDLKQSGCAFGMCGIESGDREQLRRMRKGCRQDEAHRGIDLSTEAGITLLMTFIVGYPGETRQSIDNTLEFINTLQSSNHGSIAYQVYPFYLLPSTAVDEPEYRADYNLMGRGADWSHSTMTSEEARNVWAPYFFKQAKLSYQYYAVESAKTVERRNDFIQKRKDLTVAFLDSQPDDAIQERFADLYRMLRYKAAPEVPNWWELLAPRELQPGSGERRGAF